MMMMMQYDNNLLKRFVKTQSTRATVKSDDEIYTVSTKSCPLNILK